jgi:hypothetical protein
MPCSSASSGMAVTVVAVSARSASFSSVVQGGVHRQPRPPHHGRQQRALDQQRQDDDAGGDEHDVVSPREGAPLSSVTRTESATASETAPRKPATALTTRAR